MQTHLGLTLSALGCAVLLTACTPALYSVGGTMPSVNGGKGMEKAQFSLLGNSCDGFENSTGSMTYHDKSVFNPNGKGLGLQFTALVIAVSDCSNPQGSEEAELCADEELLEVCAQFGSTAPIKFFFANYVSTNKTLPGSGLAFGCVQDNGQGRKALFKDKAFISLEDGPYDGYYNVGTIQGNIQTYVCPAPVG